VTSRACSPSRADLWSPRAAEKADRHLVDLCVQTIRFECLSSVFSYEIL